MTYDNVYSGSTNYHLLALILHRLAHPEGSAVLFVLNLNHTDENLHRFGAQLQKDGIFDSVQIYDEQGLWSRLAHEVTGTASLADAGVRMTPSLLSAVSRIVVPHFQAIVAGFAHETTSWHVAADHSSFGVALVFLKTRYAQFEDHAGGYEHPDILLETMAQQNPFKHKVYTLLADARVEYIRQHVVDTLSDPIPSGSAPVEQLRIRNSLDGMPREELEALLRAYDYQPERGPSDDTDAALLITQPFARWKFLDWMQQKELYAMLVDFFAPDATLIVKPHPRDDLIPYAQWFPKAQLAPASVPMELVLTSLRPARALTIGSTAIFPLQGTDMETVVLGAGFEKQYRQMPRLFAIAIALDWLGIRQVKSSEDFPSDALLAFMGPTGQIDRDADEAEAKVCWSQSPTASDVDAHRVVASFTAWGAPAEGVFEHRLVMRRQQMDRAYIRQSVVYFYTRDGRAFDDVKGKTMERNLPNLEEDLTILFPSDEDPVFLQAQVVSLQAQVRELTKQVREFSAVGTRDSGDDSGR